MACFGAHTVSPLHAVPVPELPTPLCSLLQADDSPYLEAAENSDLATLSCLGRLGCPRDPDGATFTKVIERGPDERPKVELLCWLHAEGCPVDWQQARAAAQRAAARRARDWPRPYFVEKMLSWVEGQMRAVGILTDAAPGPDEED